MIPSVSSATLTTDDFTFEFWLKRRNSTNTITFCVDRNNAAVTFVSVSDVVTNGLKPTNAYTTGSSTIIYRPSTFDIQSWNHFAFTFHLGTLYCFLNGKLSSTTPVSVGSNVITGLNVDWQWSDFNIDEFMSCMEAKYLADFTPPTKPYQLRT